VKADEKPVPDTKDEIEKGVTNFMNVWTWEFLTQIIKNGIGVSNNPKLVVGLKKNKDLVAEARVETWSYKSW